MSTTIRSFGEVMSNDTRRSKGGNEMSEWISVNINDRYAVNRVGEVKNLETNKKLNPSFNKAGYRAEIQIGKMPSKEEKR